MVIQSILQVMGLSDPEVTQLVNGTDCGPTGGQEPATWCRLRKGEVGVRIQVACLQWRSSSPFWLFGESSAAEAWLQKQRG